MNRDSKIFIAGHRGLVGSALLRRLKKKGYSRIVTRKRAELDLTDNRAVRDFFQKEAPEYVFLAAAKVGGIHANDTYPAEFIYSNLSIQTNVLHQSYLSGVKRLLFLGSSCIYPRLCPQPMKEKHLLTGPLEPTNAPYAVAKIAGIEMCHAYNRQHNTQFIPIMPTNLYGPNDNFDLYTSHVLPALIRKCRLIALATEKNMDAIIRDEALFGPIPEEIKAQLGIAGNRFQTGKNPKLVIWGTGSPKREFMHVDDLADASVFLMSLPQEAYLEFGDLATEERREVFPMINVGTGKDQTIKELACQVREKAGIDCEIVYDRSKPDGTPQKQLDLSRLNRLRWRHQIELPDGIGQTLFWYEETCGI